MQTSETQVIYYAERANEYDITSGYQLPRAAASMAPIKARYQLAFDGADVLEIACGTGFWTRVVAETARSVTASDVNPEVIRLARERVQGLSNVQFVQADAFTLEGIRGPFSGALAQFWWSHIPVVRLPEFLRSLHSKLLPGARVMFMDALQSGRARNRRYDSNGDLLVERTLRDGRRYEIIKNVPHKDTVMSLLEPIAEDIVFREYPANGGWTLSYRTR